MPVLLLFFLSNCCIYLPQKSLALTFEGRGNQDVRNSLVLFGVFFPHGFNLARSINVTSIHNLQKKIIGFPLSSIDISVLYPETLWILLERKYSFLCV